MLVIIFRNRKWNKPRREGPYTVVKATPTVVQVEGSTTWYHLNHCWEEDKEEEKVPEEGLIPEPPEPVVKEKHENDIEHDGIYVWCLVCLMNINLGPVARASRELSKVGNVN